MNPSSRWLAPHGLACTTAALLLSTCPIPDAQAAPAPIERVADAPANRADGEIDPMPGVTSFQTTITVGSLERRVVYLRPTAQSAAPAPLIVMLHYHHGTPEKMANLTRVSRLVADHGVWVALPAAHERAWNFNPAIASRTDDSAFLARVIDDTVAAYPVDSRRVYMTGFSQGGFMTQRFLCEHSERLTAAAWSSATLLDSLRAVCQPSHPLPVMTFHGTADPRVFYGGQIGTASAPETAAFYAGLDDCAVPPMQTPLPDTAQDQTTVMLNSYDSCSSGKPVHFYSIQGGGHTWPGNPWQVGLLGRTTQDIDATLLVYAFFSAFSR